MEFRIDWDSKRLTSFDKLSDYLNCTAVYIDLFYEEKKNKVDLSLFNNLEYLVCKLSEVKNLNRLKSLYSLTVFGYKKGADDLNNLSNLKELTLTKGDIDNVDFLKSYHLLECLQLNYLSKLTRITELKNCVSLKHLEIQSCKKIENLIENLAELKSLEVGCSVC